jgi:hypothetical protein
MSSRLSKVAVLVSLLLAGATLGMAQMMSDVRVVNTPSVTVPAPIPHSRMERFLNQPISSETGSCAQWVLVGTVDTSGYTRLMLSLAGEVLGSGLKGTVGAALVPGEAFVQKAMEKRIVPFSLRAEASEIDESGIFATEPFSLPVSFPSYWVYMYNTGERPVKANLYVYLTQ